MEATTSLFLEGGLLAACNVLYGYHLSEVFTVGLGFGLNTPVGDLLPGTDFFARLEAELPAGKVVPYLSFDIGNVQSVERHAVFRFCQSRYGALFPAPECRPHLSQSEISIYVAASLSLQALFA